MAIRLNAQELEVVKIANPAVGAEWSFVAPGDGAFRLLGAAFTFNTSAVVDNRIVSLIVDDQTSEVLRLPANNVQTANGVQDYSIYPGSIASSLVGTHWILPCPTDGVVLLPGFRLRSETRLRDVGDFYTDIALYLERFPNGPVERILPTVPTFLTDKA